ncbi:MAG: triose-phosphate isomerase [Pseudomonadales bacterium]
MTDTARRQIVAANWKMHGSLDMIQGYVGHLQPVEGVELVLFPPATHLAPLVSALDAVEAHVAVGAQDVHDKEAGAYTGEVAATMVADLGGRWAIVGHSERRRYAAESDELVAAKVVAAFRAGLQPVLCVGETLEERQAGDAEAVVARQLSCVTNALSAEAIRRLVVAYEPVWAIGTGHSATLAQVETMHSAIRRVLNDAVDGEFAATVLYGGSVNEKNAIELFSSSWWTAPGG